MEKDSIGKMSSDLFVPFQMALLRNPGAESYSIWYKGERAGRISYWKNCLNMNTVIQKPPSPTPSPYSRAPGAHQVGLSYLTQDPNVLPTDFTIGGVEQDSARPLDFYYDFTAEEIAEAERIFQDVFGGNWKSLGQWIYKTKFPRTPRISTRGVRDRFSDSKTLKISYEPPTIRDVDSETGSVYTVEDETVPDFDGSKFVFLADGRLLDIGQRELPYEPPAGMKLNQVNVGGTPLIWWLLWLKPTEFKDTATMCLAFKKMIYNQARLMNRHYLLHRLWLMTADEMVRVRMYSTKVIVDNKNLSLEEVKGLMDRKNDFWIGGHRIMKLFPASP